MNDARVEYFLELIKVKMGHFKQTRDIEFKVNIAAWTLIAATYHSLSGSAYDITNCILIIGLFIFAAIHISWMYLIQKSEHTDLESIYNFRKKIVELVKVKDEDNEEPPQFGNLWLFIECGFTIFLLLTVGVLLYKSPY